MTVDKEQAAVLLEAEPSQVTCVAFNERLCEHGDAYETLLRGTVDILFRDGTVLEGCRFDAYSNGWEINVSLQPEEKAGERLVLLYNFEGDTNVWEMDWIEWPNHPWMKPHYRYLN